MFRNLIFDWSGTLVDDLPPVLDATNRVLEVYGKTPLDRDEFRDRFEDLAIGENVTGLNASNWIEHRSHIYRH